MKTLSIILIILGVLLVITGAVFKILHWPDMFFGLFSGPVVLLAGILLLVFRKQIF